MEPKICLVPRLQGIGGMVSFQSKLVEGLSRRGIKITYELGGTTHDSILVIGGTRNLYQLWQAKRRGIRIVQRLDGMNWIHRVLNTGSKHWLRAEYGNFILKVIRSTFADKIAYQSQFSREWWERERGKTTSHNVIIHNGVDLTKYKPAGTDRNQEDVIRLLLVEGSLLGGYEFGLENAVRLAEDLANLANQNKRVELMVVGKASDDLQEYWENWVQEKISHEKLCIKWIGIVDHMNIHEIYQKADLLFSADINAACPNSVIESLASGTPVVAFETGALPELLDNQGGVVVPYGGDPWKIDPPDITSLAENAYYILNNLNDYRISARKRAESAFALDFMIDQYVELLLG